MLNYVTQFKDQSLLDHRSFIGGEWIDSSTKATFDVYGTLPTPANNTPTS